MFKRFKFWFQTPVAIEKGSFYLCMFYMLIRAIEDLLKIIS